MREIWEYRVMQGTFSVGYESANVELKFPREQLCWNTVAWIHVTFVSASTGLLDCCYSFGVLNLCTSLEHFKFFSHI